MFSMIMSIVVTLLFVLVVVLTLLWCWFQCTHRELLKAAAKIHCSIPPLPLIGHALHTTSLEASTSCLLKLMEEGRRQGLNSTCFWAGPLPLILVFGLDDVQKVLTCSSTIEKGDEYRFFKTFLKGRDSILTAPSEEWKTTRRHLNPLFHQQSLEQLVPVFNRNCRELVSDLEPYVGIEEVNMFEFVISTALQSITNTVFGGDKRYDKRSTYFEKARFASERMTELVMKRITQVWLRCDWLFEIVYKKDIEDVWNDFLNICSSFEAFHRSEKQSQIPLDDNTTKFDAEEICMYNLESAFVKLQNFNSRYDAVQFHVEAATLLAAGTDSLSVLVSSCLLILAQYQEVQEKLSEEIMSVVGPDDDVTPQSISKMFYLDQVFKETLRIANIVPFITRKTTKVLQLSQCTIPAGCNVVVCLGSLGKNPKVFPNPETFEPCRFAPDGSAAKDKKCFFPFSGGSRSCIGQRYAELVGKMIVIHVVRRYQLFTHMNIHTLSKRQAILQDSKEGYKIQLRSRTLL